MEIPIRAFELCTVFVGDACAVADCWDGFLGLADEAEQFGHRLPVSIVSLFGDIKIIGLALASMACFLVKFSFVL